MALACLKQLALIKNLFGFCLPQVLDALTGPLPSRGERAKTHNR